MHLPFSHRGSRSEPPEMSNTVGASEDEPCPENKTMFEAFEWYCPVDHKHWRRLRDAVPSLAAIGIDHMWVPPACKAGWHGSNGYDIYDLYDLGEFDQKGTKYTKWGTKEELVDMVDTADAHGIGIYWDTVLNHKAAADYTETCMAVKVDPKGTYKYSNPLITTLIQRGLTSSRCTRSQKRDR